mmetsp:Transcript_116384/g.370244  ORF Transcript_116384/g.370244 Transcript_116384/m.370244 type:complete len:107 (+) Transcript_116384:106-426(+)
MAPAAMRRSSLFAITLAAAVSSFGVRSIFNFVTVPASMCLQQGLEDTMVAGHAGLIGETVLKKRKNASCVITKTIRKLYIATYEPWAKAYGWPTKERKTTKVTKKR